MKQSIRMLLLLGATLMFTVPARAYCEGQYRAEISATYQRFDFQEEAEIEDGETVLEFLLSPANLENHPYGEAAFLEKIGSLGLSGRLHYYGSEDAKGEPHEEYGLFLNYARPGFPVVARLEWRKQAYEWLNVNPTTGFLNELQGERKFYGISLGTYLSYGLLVTAGYGEERAHDSFSTYDSNYMYFPTPTGADNIREYRVNAKYVKELNGGKAINVEASAIRQRFSIQGKSRDSEYFSLGSDFYFTRRLSAGMEVNAVNSAFRYADGKAYAVRAGYFITPSISLKAKYERFLADNESRGMWENRNFSVTVAARF